jgi:RND family efflux transporter MFP subunit
MVQLGTRNVKSLAAAFDFLPGRTFPLAYAEAEVEADPRTRTFAVVLRLLNPPSDVRILPGMTATVLVEPAAAAAPRSDEWPVPASAIGVDADGKRYVWRVDRDTHKVQRVAVEAGEVRGDQVAVRGALRPGDTIVIAGVNHLQAGDTIRPVPPGEFRIR